MALAAAPTITDWIASIAGAFAAAGAIGAFVLAFVLIRKQYSALDATTKALNDEMDWRHQERERQREEARERRAAQASQVGLVPIANPLPTPSLSMTAMTGSKGRHADLVQAFLRGSGITYEDVKHGFEVTNNSSTRITNVQMRQEHGHDPRCYVVEFEKFAGVNPLAVLPPGTAARFYWIEPVSDLQVYVDFTDEAGVQWRLHHRDGLSESTGEK